MLAKILKGDDGVGHQPFVLPRLDHNNRQQGSISPYTIPSFDDMVIDSDPLMPAVTNNNDADAVLQKARLDAARIIADAEETRSLIEQAARESAVLNAEADTESSIAEQVRDLRTALVNTIDEVSSLGASVTAKAEHTLVELALQIAKKIVGREVTIDREIALTLVKVSLAKLHNRSIATVHLNPIDFAFVQTHRERLDFRGSLELVEDRSISVGGCLIRTETGDIDARIESQFDEISHGLLG